MTILEGKNTSLNRENSELKVKLKSVPGDCNVLTEDSILFAKNDKIINFAEAMESVA